MKKVIIGIVVLILFGVFAYFYINKSNMTEYANKLSFDKSDNYIVAVLTEETAKNYFKEDFEKINVEGENTFLFVPKYNDMFIKLYKLTLTDDGNLSEELIKETSDPFYVTCNQSDLYSNFKIKVTYDDKKLDYSPFYSLKDGSLEFNEYVLYIDK